MREMSTAIETLYDIYDELNNHYFDGILERTIITIQSNHKYKNASGWYANDIWKTKSSDDKFAEINISAEYLSDGVMRIAVVLLHEMIHHFCAKNDIRDTSNKSVYHNKRFKEQAESRGLIITESKTIGWSNSEASDEMKEFVNALNIDEKIFDIYRSMNLSDKDGKDKTKKPRKPKVEWTCSCGIVIKSKKDDLNVICGDCNQKFTKKITEGLDGEDDGE